MQFKQFSFLEFGNSLFDKAMLYFSIRVNFDTMYKFQRLFGLVGEINLKSARALVSNWSYVKEGLAQNEPLVLRLFDGIITGQRAALAKGITLVESLNPKKKAMGKTHYTLSQYSFCVCSNYFAVLSVICELKVLYNVGHSLPLIQLVSTV